MFIFLSEIKYTNGTIINIIQHASVDSEGFKIENRKKYSTIAI